MAAAPGPAGPVPAPASAWLGRWLGLVALWGCSFLLVAVALEAFTPVQVATGRVVLGGAALAVLLAVRRAPLPRPTRRELLDVAVVGVSLSALPFACIALAQTRITSVLAGLLNATTPLMTALAVLALLPGERPDRRQAAGLLLGFGGLAVLLGVWDLGTVDLVGVALMLTATLGYGVGTTWTRLRLAGSPLAGVVLPALQLAVASAVLVPVALLTGPLPLRAPGEGLLLPALALVALGVGGTGVAYVLFWRVIAVAGATRAATVTYAVPVVSTALGVLVLSEPLRWHQPVGGVVVLLGVALTQRLRLPRRPGRRSRRDDRSAPARA